MRFGIAVACAFMASQAGAAVKVGVEFDGGCYPFSCFTESEGTEYQQVYDATAFSNAVSISGISFDNYASEGFDMGDAVYSIAFFLTPKPVNGLSTDLNSNLGSLLGDFGTFNIAGPNPSTLTITGTAFNYDPTWGNLLMQVRPLSFTREACCAYWNTDVPPNYAPDPWSPEYPDQTSSVWATGKFGTQATSAGLVTTFTTRNISAVPEPASWAMMMLGFGAIGVASRYRKVPVAAA